MSDQGSTDKAQGGAAADSAKRARVRQEMDKRWVEAAQRGDTNAFGRLYDEWFDHVFDQAKAGGATDEQAAKVARATFSLVWRDLAKLKTPSAFGAQVLRLARREADRVGVKPSHTGAAGPTGEDRLSRATNLEATGSDPEVAAMLREAASVLDQKSRDVLDLHYRHGLTQAETAAVIGEPKDKVVETLGKLPAALGALTRARMLWRGGAPEHEPLAAAVKEAKVDHFGADAVRTINGHAKGCDQCRARALIGLSPLEVYTAIPVTKAASGVKHAVTKRLVGDGVPLGLPDAVAKPAEGKVEAKAGDARKIEAKAPADPAKTAAVAAVAAAAVAAEKTKDEADAKVADAPVKEKRAERKAREKAEAAAKEKAAAEAKEAPKEAPAADEAPAEPLAARRAEDDAKAKADEEAAAKKAAEEAAAKKADEDAAAKKKAAAEAKEAEAAAAKAKVAADAQAAEAAAAKEKAAAEAKEAEEKAAAAKAEAEAKEAEDLAAKEKAAARAKAAEEASAKAKAAEEAKQAEADAKRKADEDAAKAEKEAAAKKADDEKAAEAQEAAAKKADDEKAAEAEEAAAKKDDKKAAGAKKAAAAAGAAAATVGAAEAKADDKVDEKADDEKADKVEKKTADDKVDDEKVDDKVDDKKVDEKVDDKKVDEKADKAEKDTAGKEKAAAGAAAAGAAAATVGAAEAKADKAAAMKEPADAKPAGEPVVADEYAEGEGRKSKAGVFVGIAAAVVLLAGVAFAMTRGGSDNKVSAGADSTTTTSGQTSTTPRSTASTATTTTTTAPTTTETTASGPTTSPSVSVTSGPITPQTTLPTTTTTIPPTVINMSFGLSETNVSNNAGLGYLMAAPGAPKLIWSVTADKPVTVIVTGPEGNNPSGFNSTAQSNPGYGVCPGVKTPSPEGERCVVAPGTYVYRITVTPADNPSAARPGAQPLLVTT